MISTESLCASCDAIVAYIGRLKKIESCFMSNSPEKYLDDLKEYFDNYFPVNNDVKQKLYATCRSLAYEQHNFRTWEEVLLSASNCPLFTKRQQEQFYIWKTIKPAEMIARLKALEAEILDGLSMEEPEESMDIAAEKFALFFREEFPDLGPIMYATLRIAQEYLKSFETYKTRYASIEELLKAGILYKQFNISQRTDLKTLLSKVTGANDSKAEASATLATHLAEDLEKLFRTELRMGTRNIDPNNSLKRLNHILNNHQVLLQANSLSSVVHGLYSCVKYVAGHSTSYNSALVRECLEAITDPRIGKIFTNRQKEQFCEWRDYFYENPNAIDLTREGIAGPAPKKAAVDRFSNGDIRLMERNQAVERSSSLKYDGYHYPPFLELDSYPPPSGGMSYPLKPGNPGYYYPPVPRPMVPPHYDPHMQPYPHYVPGHYPYAVRRDEVNPPYDKGDEYETTTYRRQEYEEYAYRRDPNLEPATTDHRYHPNPYYPAPYAPVPVPPRHQAYYGHHGQPPEVYPRFPPEKNESPLEPPNYQKYPSGPNNERVIREESNERHYRGSESSRDRIRKAYQEEAVDPYPQYSGKPAYKEEAYYEGGNQYRTPARRENEYREPTEYATSARRPERTVEYNENVGRSLQRERIASNPRKPENNYDTLVYEDQDDKNDAHYRKYQEALHKNGEYSLNEKVNSYLQGSQSYNNSLENGSHNNGREPEAKQAQRYANDSEELSVPIVPVLRSTKDVEPRHFKEDYLDEEAVDVFPMESQKMNANYPYEEPRSFPAWSQYPREQQEASDMDYQKMNSNNLYVDIGAQNNGPTYPRKQQTGPVPEEAYPGPNTQFAKTSKMVDDRPSDFKRNFEDSNAIKETYDYNESRVNKLKTPLKSDNYQYVETFNSQSNNNASQELRKISSKSKDFEKSCFIVDENSQRKAAADFDKDINDLLSKIDIGDSNGELYASRYETRKENVGDDMYIMKNVNRPMEDSAKYDRRMARDIGNQRQPATAYQRKEPKDNRRPNGGGLNTDSRGSMRGRGSARSVRGQQPMKSGYRY